MIIADGGIDIDNPKNTLNALMLTKNNNKIDGIKIDIRLTLDNKLILSKYNNLKINTISNILISESNYKQIKKTKFDNKIYKDYIINLETLLKKYNKNKIIILNIHSAYDKNEILVKELKKIIDKYKYNYYIESQNDNVLKYLIKLLPNYKIGKIYNKYPDLLQYGISFCDINVNYINNNINLYNEIIYSNVENNNLKNKNIVPKNIIKYIRQNL